MSNTLKVIPYLQTGLNAGEYSIEATQTYGAELPLTVTQRLLVAGPRFTLETDQVLHVFPPPSTNGDYNNFLPYIVLRRATLPWERQMTSDENLPFLALLLLSEAELKADVRLTTPLLKDFCSGRGLTSEVSDDPDARIRVVEGTGAVLKKLLPSAAEMKLLTHVRQREGGPQQAVILAARRPQASTRYAAHLVSLEGLDPDKLPDTTMSLPSLYSWEISCGTDRVGLVERLLELHCDQLRLPDRGSAASAAFKALRRDGYSAMPYFLAWGDRAHAVYRGPLLPVSVTEPVQTSSERAAGRASSEGLVDYFTDLGLADLSLAAAWELGRFLMLRRREVAVEYFQFRRRQAGLAYATASVAEENHLVVNDVPYTQTDVLPGPVREFCVDLLALRGVPFPYLVPEPRMLPATSLRVFRVDRRWLACLVGGALSLGRSRSVDKERESKYLKRLLADVGDRSGLLIRSPVVAEHPDQPYSLYDKRPDEPHVPQNDKRTPLPILRRERLAPDVLFLLADGVLLSIEANETPRAAHFGFKEGTAPDPVTGKPTEIFEKDLRNPETFVELGGDANTVRLNHYRPGDGSVLDVKKLAGDFAAKSALIKAEGHHFGLQLIESGARGLKIVLSSGG